MDDICPWLTYSQGYAESFQGQRRIESSKDSIGPSGMWLAVGEGGSVEADAVASRQNGRQRQPDNLK